MSLEYWRALYTTLVIRDGGHYPILRTTPGLMAAFEREMGFTLPAGYKGLMEVFGPGELTFDHWILAPLGEADSDNSMSLAWLGAIMRVHALPNRSLHDGPLAGRIVWFCRTGGRRSYGWDPLAFTEADTGECAIYELSEYGGAVNHVADTFRDFIEEVILGEHAGLGPTEEFRQSRTFDHAIVLPREEDGAASPSRPAFGAEEWLTASTPHPLLDLLRYGPGETTLRQFACACVRRVWHLLTDERLRAAVEAAERFADGLLDETELASVRPAAAAAVAEAEARGEASPTRANDAATGAALAALDCCAELMRGPEHFVPFTLTVGAAQAVCDAAWAAAPPGEAVFVAAKAVAAERRAQADILRCLFPNPFRAPTLAPAQRTPTVQTLAEAAAADPGPALLAVLSDALEEAGCADVDLLSHLRSPGPHVRRCWAVDLALGRR